MPNCFTLTRKGDAEPSNLQDVDRVICQNLDLPFDENKWTCDWYDHIGLRLALGQSFDKMIDEYSQSIEAGKYTGFYYRMRSIAAFLNENYISDCWYEPR